MAKHPLDKKIEYGMNFKGFYYVDTTLRVFYKTIALNSKVIENCYKLEHHYPERVINPNDIEAVYWTDLYGLTAYTNKNGETWVVVGR